MFPSAFGIYVNKRGNMLNATIGNNRFRSSLSLVFLTLLSSFAPPFFSSPSSNTYTSSHLIIGTFLFIIFTLLFLYCSFFYCHVSLHHVFPLFFFLQKSLTQCLHYTRCHYIFDTSLSLFSHFSFFSVPSSVVMSRSTMFSPIFSSPSASVYTSSHHVFGILYYSYFTKLLVSLKVTLLLRHVLHTHTCLTSGINHVPDIHPDSGRLRCSFTVLGCMLPLQRHVAGSF